MLKCVVCMLLNDVDEIGSIVCISMSGCIGQNDSDINVHELNHVKDEVSLPMH